MKYLIMLMLFVSSVFAQLPSNTEGRVVYSPTEYLIYNMSDESLLILLKLILLVIVFFIVYYGLILFYAKQFGRNMSRINGNWKLPFYRNRLGVFLITSVLTIPCYVLVKYILLILMNILSYLVVLL